MSNGTLDVDLQSYGLRSHVSMGSTSLYPIQHFRIQKGAHDGVLNGALQPLCALNPESNLHLYELQSKSDEEDSRREWLITAPLCLVLRLYTKKNCATENIFSCYTEKKNCSLLKKLHYFENS